MSTERRWLGDFNERKPPKARFYGFQAKIEPQDTPDLKTGFNNGIPGSKLNPKQATQRAIVLHKWINNLTRVGNLVDSYGLQYGAAMPFWLHDHEGQPICLLGRRVDMRHGPRHAVYG
ncbi:hypothetical protein LTR74_018553 [Friedmanniomyces endolithicus]|nr:hypothetical protein LTR74_018553 [Friedmanniomyces endolithicus]